MEEQHSLIKQVFSLGLWLQTNTKLRTTITLNGLGDFLSVEIYSSDEILVNFLLEKFSVKSQERVEHEMRLLIVQLLELKNTKHYLTNEKL